jgi:hypothetical protein
MSISLSELHNSVPKKYHSFIAGKPTKVTKVIDLGLVAYTGEINVQHITYEYGAVSTAPHTVILPALINRNDNGNLTQISVIIHY